MSSEREPMVAAALAQPEEPSKEGGWASCDGPGACGPARRFWRLKAAALLMAAAGGSMLVLALRPVAVPAAARVAHNVTRLPVFQDFQDYEPIDPLAMGQCSGVIMAMALWTANIGLIVRSSAAWCQVERNFQEIYDDNFPWYPNGTPKEAAVASLQVKNYLQPPTDTLPEDHGLGFRRPARQPSPRAAHRAQPALPMDRKEFLRMALNKKEQEGRMSTENEEAFERMKSAKDHALEAIVTIDNDTLAEAWDKFLTQQHRDLVALCIRDVLEFVSASAIVAEYGIAAKHTCVKGAWTGHECGSAVAGLVNKFHRVARGATQMEIRCPKRSDEFTIAATFLPDASYDCEGRMEIVGWEMSTIGSKMEKAIAMCPEEQGEVVHNYGGCVTMIVSSAAFVGAAGISFDAGKVYDCDNLTTTDVALALRAIAGDDEAYEDLVNGYHTRNLKCARDIISGARSLGIATMQATKAAKFCGTLPHMACKTDIAKSITAFIGAAESAVLAAASCQLKPYAGSSDVKKVKTDCTAYSASWVKEMSVTAALAIEAADSCRLTSTAAGECGASISKVLAAFAYMMERLAFSGRNCPFGKVRTGDKSYACGQNLEQAGEAVVVASSAIGAAMMNCGLGMVKAKTKPVGLNRRFWVAR